MAITSKRVRGDTPRYIRRYRMDPSIKEMTAAKLAERQRRGKTL
jgi:hypothetical protein